MAKDISESTPTPKATEMVTVYIDPEDTDGGLWTNFERWVGEKTVTREVAQDIQRRIKEYKQVVKKLSDPDTFIVMKNAQQIENAYLATKAANLAKVKSGEWSEEWGLLDPRQWEHVSETEKKRLRALKQTLTGYTPKF